MNNLLFHKLLSTCFQSDIEFIFAMLPAGELFVLGGWIMVYKMKDLCA